MDGTQEGRGEVVPPCLALSITVIPAVLTQEIAMKLSAMNRTQEGRKQEALPILVPDKMSSADAVAVA